MRSKNNLATADPRGVSLSTRKMAAALHVKEQTPRASFCRNGHWMGMVPVKLPNGRLLWRAADVDRLLSGKAAEDLMSGLPPALMSAALDTQPLMQSGLVRATEGVEGVEVKVDKPHGRPSFDREKEEGHGG